MNTYYGLLFLLVMILLSSCYYDKEDQLYPNAPCDSSAVTFGGTIEPIIQQRCATSGCHSAGSSAGALTTYSEVRAYCVNGRFQERVLVQKDMPPSGLNSCELGKIQKWIDAGYPNN